MMRRSPFSDVADGPSEDATVLLDRPTTSALGCFALILCFLGVVGATAVAYAATGFGGTPTTAQRATGSVVAAIVFALLVALLGTAARGAHRWATVAIDGTGVWWNAYGKSVLIRWEQLAAMRVLPPTGPKRGESGRPTLELFPFDAHRPAVAERGVPPLAFGAPPEDGLPSLRMTLRLADGPAASRAERAVRAHAPQLRLLPSPSVPKPVARRWSR